MLVVNTRLKFKTDNKTNSQLCFIKNNTYVTFVTYIYKTSIKKSKIIDIKVLLYFSFFKENKHLRN